MKFCPECGTPRDDAAAVCTNCGHNFAADAALPKSRMGGRAVWRDPRVLLLGGAAAVAGVGVFLWSNGAFSSFGAMAGGDKEAAAVAFDMDLMPVSFGGKCGYVDSSGKLVINPQFDHGSYFVKSVDLAPVSIGNKWGLIDRKGQYAVNPQFDYIYASGSPVVFWAKVGEQWGAIDEKGGFVINPQFARISSFDGEGQAVVSTGEKSGVIDRKGEFKIAPQFDWIMVEDLPGGAVRIFNQGLAAARVDDKWGFIDESGQWVINPQFNSVSHFDDGGLAAVQLTTFRDYTYDDGYGNQIPQREEVSRWGYVDRTGKIAINPQFDHAESFGEGGLAPVKTGDLWGYIDKEGAYRINPQFAGAGAFTKTKSGLVARVATKGESDSDTRIGVIDTTGAFKITPQFDQMQDFDRNGRAVVNVGSHQGLIDETGKLMVNPVYDSLNLISGGTEYIYIKSAGATAGSGVKEMGRIDRTGKILSTIRGARCGG